jgi:Flagellar basal body-associated protein FliL.
MRKTLLFLAAARLFATALAVAIPVMPAFAAEPEKKEDAAKSDEKGGEKAGENADAGKKDQKKPAVHRITQSESYVMIEPFYASIVDGQRPQGLLMVGIGLDVPDKTLRERITREMPRLRDVYVRCLMSFAAVNTRAWRQPDVNDMADRLQTVTDRYLARKGAKVLLAQVMIRLNK